MAHIERLQRVADLLERTGPYEGLPPIPDELFDMGYFGRKTKCGTKLCACGWAASDPWFTDSGFKLIADPSEPQRFLMIAFDDWQRSDAANMFFEIEEHDFDYLFGEDNDSDIKDTVARIRDFIREQTEAA